MNRIAIPAFAAVLAFSLQTASAATIAGDNVMFEYDDTTLFGEAMVIGDTIFFLPSNFVAQSLNGEGTVTANETLNIRVTSKSDQQLITDFSLIETGDYKLIGDDASVSASGLLSATSNTQLDPSTAPFLQPYRITELFDAGPLTVKGDVLTEWEATALIDLSDKAGWDSDTDVTVQLENLLTATTLNLGEQAFIQKKFGAIGVAVSVIPVPGAIFLFPSALGALAWFRRRRIAA